MATITAYLKNCTSNVLPNYTDTDLQNLNITLTANSGYIFKENEKPALTYFRNGTGDYVQHTFVLSSDKKTATITNLNLIEEGFNSNYGDELEINASTDISIEEPKTTIITYLTNCTSNVLPTYEETDLQNLNIILTVITDSIFKDSDLPSLNYRQTSTGDFKKFDFVLSSDRKTATLTGLNLINDGFNISLGDQLELNGVAYIEEPIGGSYGSINVYKVTTEDLDAFALLRFGENVDLGSYVRSIRNIYVDVEIKSTDTIKCGNTNTNIEVNAPKDEIILVDFGEVFLPFKNGNNTDYNTDIQLFLPFIGFKSISNDYLGTNLGLKYSVNIITGDGVIFLSSNGVIFEVINCLPYKELLYTTLDTKRASLIGNDTFNAQTMYGFNPYLIIKWFNSENNNILNNTNERDVIGYYVGYAEFTEIEPIVNDQMYLTESQMIIDSLTKGVTIL